MKTMKLMSCLAFLWGALMSTSVLANDSETTSTVSLMFEGGT